MSNKEHMLAIVEPRTGGEITIDIAKETRSRGGNVTVLIVISESVQRDIRLFAAPAELSNDEAQTQLLERFRRRCIERLGGDPQINTHFGPLGSKVVKYVTADTTTIALPALLATDGLVDRIVAYSGRPAMIVPSRLAVAA
jgi:hypothetical protein